MNQTFGIDISEFQGDFNFRLAKEEGVRFTIIRAGYTGSDNGKSKNIDPLFEENYRRAKEIGIPVGAYWFSRATSYELGRQEAEFMYETCLRGKKFEYPIAIDVEDNKYQRKAGKKAVTEAIKGFGDYLEEKGYYFIIYASVNWFRNYIDTSQLNRFDKWVADWTNIRPRYPKGGMWQFAGGKSRDIAGVDCDKDYAYKDYPKIMLDRGLNGFLKKDEYYDIPDYDGPSLIDALKSIGVDSSFANRKLIAQTNDISDYQGTASQNTKLLNLLKAGKLKKR